MKKKIIIILICVFVVVASIVYIISKRIEKFESYLNQLEIEEINLEAIKDGEYSSEIETGVITVKILVEVENHEIVNIDLIEHKNGKGEAAEVIVDDIVKEQSVLIDDISGATYSSKIIRKAVSQALED